MASEIGALCHLYFETCTFSVLFHEVALLGATFGKALKMLIYSKIAP